MAKTLFDSGTYASCSVASAPVRREPSHRAEQTTQLLFGERAEVLERLEEADWARIRTEWDGYEGWCKWGQLQPIAPKEFYTERRVLVAAHGGVLSMAEGVLQLPIASELSRPAAALQTAGGPGKFKGKKLDIRKAQYTPGQLLAFCQSFLHCPYLWGGRTVAGLDCSGLVQIAFRLCGLRVPRDTDQQVSMGEEVHFLQEAEAGDMAFFDNAEGRVIHVGILIDQKTIIHATDAAGRVVIDTIDTAGIISRSLRRRTHNLRTIRRIGPVLTAY